MATILDSKIILFHTHVRSEQLINNYGENCKITHPYSNSVDTSLPSFLYRLQILICLLYFLRLWCYFIDFSHFSFMGIAWVLCIIKNANFMRMSVKAGMSLVWNWSNKQCQRVMKKSQLSSKERKCICFFPGAAVSGRALLVQGTCRGKTLRFDIGNISSMDSREL